jgi:hypothetical protein
MLLTMTASAVVVREAVVVDAGVERAEQVRVLRRGVDRHRRGPEQVELLRVGVELETAEAEVGAAADLVGDVGAADVDRAEPEEARTPLQLRRQPRARVGVDAGGLHLVGERGEADRAVDPARVEQLQQAVRRAARVDRGGEDVGVVCQDVRRAHAAR